MSRHRDSQEHWRSLIEQQRRSGLSVARFCAPRGLAVSTFFAWRRRLARAPLFVEVSSAAGAPAAGAPPLELLLPGGLTLRVPARFDAASLRQVVEALS